MTIRSPWIWVTVVLLLSTPSAPARVVDATTLLDTVNGLLSGGGGDFNGDGRADYQDLFELARRWQFRTTELVNTSPANGEGEVAVTRETILYFDAPVDASSITADAIRAEFAGQRLAARLHVSPDGRRVTLFYSTTLPASARVRVTVNGDLLRDANGNGVDIDRNGVPGGMGLFSFDTLSLTTLPGTSVCGRVIASEQLEPIEGNSPINVGLPGVMITVDGTDLFTITDDLGNFRLEPAPAGTFFVHIDGRTSTREIPEGAYYPFVGKSWESIPGQETIVGDVFLPLVVPNSLQPVSQTEDTTIGFPQAVVDRDPRLAHARVTVPADSLFSDDGTRGGMVGIAPVPPDRLPGPLPPDVSPALVITVQTDGATNFDEPASLCLPNLPNPNTGEVKAPGEESALWSFNHDTGRFEPVALMVVSEDGTSVCTVPGEGVMAPGWHFDWTGTLVEVPIDSSPDLDDLFEDVFDLEEPEDEEPCDELFTEEDLFDLAYAIAECDELRNEAWERLGEVYDLQQDLAGLEDQLAELAGSGLSGTITVEQFIQEFDRIAAQKELIALQFDSFIELGAFLAVEEALACSDAVYEDFYDEACKNPETSDCPYCRLLNSYFSDIDILVEGADFVLEFESGPYLQEFCDAIDSVYDVLEQLGLITPRPTEPATATPAPTDTPGTPPPTDTPGTPPPTGTPDTPPPTDTPGTPPPTDTPEIPSPTPTDTPEVPPLTDTAGPTHTPTHTPTNTATNTPTYTPSNTPTYTPTYTPTDTDTPSGILCCFRRLFASAPLTNQLLEVDPDSGMGVVIGPFSGAAGTTIEIDWTLEGTVLYGTTRANSEIVQIDPLTGAVSGNVPVAGGAEIDALEPDPVRGWLGITGDPSQLVQLNLNTGAVAPVGLTGFGRMGGLAFNCTFDVLFAISAGETPPTLYRIDPSSGAAAFQAATTMPAAAESLEFNDADLLLAGGSDGMLYRIHPVTGQATALGPIGVPEISGLSFQPRDCLSATDTPTNTPTSTPVQVSAGEALAGDSSRSDGRGRVLIALARPAVLQTPPPEVIAALEDAADAAAAAADAADLAAGFADDFDAFAGGMGELADGLAEVLFLAGGFPDSYYRITLGDTVFRGLTGSGGGLRLRLAPDTPYVLEIVNLRAGAMAVSRGVTPPNGRTGYFAAPDLVSLVGAADTDNDQLPDVAEPVVGTSSANPDTDNDGTRDGAEVLNGTDPLDGLPARTGIIGSIDTPGRTIDICAVNDLAIVADSESGITVFNVFNGMKPLIYAQVDTPGTAQAVACPGRWAAVADGDRGLAIVDLLDPAAARITQQVSLGSQARAVAAAGGLAFAGLANGIVASVDLATGLVLQRLLVASRAIEDLAVGGDYLYALTSEVLYVLSLRDRTLTRVNAVSPQASQGVPRMRLFVGSELLYVIHSRGYNTFSLEDPTAPALLAPGNTRQGGWRHLVDNGSGSGIATVGLTGAPDPANTNVSLYDASDPTQVDVFRTQFVTPGVASALSIYNGLAYVADYEAGMQVVNYLPYDASGEAPSVSIVKIPAGGVIEEGQIARVVAQVADDVQVRNVEFYLNGEKVFTDGNYPFEYRFPAPSLAAIAGGTFSVQARASDTGGNAAFSNVLDYVLEPDQTPPIVVRTLPRVGGAAGSLTRILTYWNEPLDGASVSTDTFRLADVGPDLVPGSADDVPVTSGAASYDRGTNATLLTFAQVLPPGQYFAQLRPPIADAAGNEMAQPFGWTFYVFEGEDADQDGVPDHLESDLALDPTNPDTDGDGLLDGEEDFDNDGLSNTAEIAFGLDPTDEDSDDDGIRDGDEDQDGDGLSNAREFEVGSNPLAADSDLDGWPDGAEVDAGSSPVDPDSVPKLLFVARPSVLVGALGGAPGSTVPYNVTVGRPPATVLLPGPGDVDAVPPNITVAHPPVLVGIIGPAAEGDLEANLTVSRPPVTVLLPGPGTVDEVPPNVTVARPPVTVEFETP